MQYAKLNPQECITLMCPTGKCPASIYLPISAIAETDNLCCPGCGATWDRDTRQRFVQYLDQLISVAEALRADMFSVTEVIAQPFH